METMENNIPSATHQEKAKKMKKLRRWQIAVSLLGVAIIVWGVIEVICLFLNYSQTETSNDAQIEQYVSPINLRASGYIDKIYFKSPNSRSSDRTSSTIRTALRMAASAI